MQQQPPSSPGWGQPEQQPYSQYPQFYSQQPQTQYPQFYSQQPQTQYPPQQPLYPMPGQMQPPPQPPKKRRSRRNLIIGIVAAIIVIAIIAATASHGSSPSTTSTTSTTQATTQATSLPTSHSTSAPTQATNKIGAPVTSGTWIVTVNSVKTNAGDGTINIPKAGDVYLVVNVTVKNTDSSAQTTSTLLQWKLVDSQGQSYNEDITYGNSPDGDVAPGQQLRGDIAFEVPTSIHQFTLQFVGDLINNNLAQWTITV